jgi:LysR family nitrogen assimilation transcriptional regulator
MEMRQLRYFVAVVDAGSITRAAHLLHVVQSALSHQIANLEKEVGAALLLRSSGGVAPTEAGLLMYRHAQAALKSLEAARQAIRASGTEIRGAVAIGIPNSTAIVLALPLLKAVRMKLPNVELSIIEGLSTMHAEQLAAGKLDLAILFEPTPPKGFEAILLFNEKLHFVSADVRAREAYSGMEAISLREVVKWPLLLSPKPTGIRLLFEGACMRAGLQLQVLAELSGVQTIRGAVNAGLGSTVMMATNARPSPERNNLLILPIRNPQLQRPGGLSQLVHSSLTPAAESVKALTIQTVRELISGDNWPGGSLVKTRGAPINRPTSVDSVGER